MTPSIFSHENLGTGRMHGWGPGSPMSGALARMGPTPGNHGWVAGGVPPGFGTGNQAVTRLVHEGKGLAACGAKSKMAGFGRDGEEPVNVEGCGCGGECSPRVGGTGGTRTFANLPADDDGPGLPLGVSTPAVMSTGALQWAYDGRQEFGSGLARPVAAQAGARAGAIFATEGARGVGLEAGRTVRVDRAGRRWLLAEVDEQYLHRRIAQYDELVRAEVGNEPSAMAGHDLAPEESENETAVPHVLQSGSWAHYDCDGGAGYDVSDYSGGDRVKPLSDVSSPNVRQKKTVLLAVVVHDTGEQFTCSGVMVDDQTLLTAAHCVSGEGSIYDVYNMQVYTLGNVYEGAQTVGVDSVTTPVESGYDGSLVNDYAVLKLQKPLSPGVGWMAMSQADDSVLMNATHIHDGYPNWGPECVENSSHKRVIIATYGGINWAVPAFWRFDAPGRHLYSAYGRAKRVSEFGIGFRVSSGNGMSGGPYYYCPEGCSESAGAHFITALTHASVGSGETQNGPKARNFRSWVIAQM